MPYIIRPIRIRTTAAGLFAGALLSAAVPAVAAAACPSNPVSHAFAAAGDNAPYALVQGGTFEAGAPGWSVDQGEVISEHVPVTHGSHALVVKPRGRVISPAFCVSDETPTFRFMDRLLHGHGELHVGLRWTDASGEDQEVDVATLQPEPSWQASPVLELASNLPLAEAGGSLDSVRLVFETTHHTSVAIAGVYIDPYSR